MSRSLWWLNLDNSSLTCVRRICLPHSMMPHLSTQDFKAALEFFFISSDLFDLTVGMGKQYKHEHHVLSNRPVIRREL